MPSSQYDPDPVVRCISDYWGDTEGEWDKYKSNFATRPKAERVTELRKFDSWLDTQTRPTREHAEILSRKRQVEDIHWALDRIGR